MRILFADDQIPDENIPDDMIIEIIGQRYPTAQRGFINAFKLMRRMVRAASEGNEVVVAQRLDDALSLVQNEEFDVALIDLGWYGDDSVKMMAGQAGWRIVDALIEADKNHPERPPTAKIVYSARFSSQPDLAQTAVKKGCIALAKPYEERSTIPLDKWPETPKNINKIEAAAQSLRATLSFLEHVRTAPNREDESRRNLDVLIRTATVGIEAARERERRWDSQTRILLAVGIVIVLAGIVGMFFFSVTEGSVTAAVGLFVGLVSRLMYKELQKTREEIDRATKRLTEAVDRAALPRAHRDPATHSPN